MSLFIAVALTVAAPDAAPAPKIRLAVVGLKAVDVPTGYAEGLTETLAASAADTEVFEVVSPRQVSAVLAYEKRKEVLGACGRDDCYQQVGRLVKARYVVGGSVTRVEERIVFSTVLIDAATGKALRRISRDSDSAAVLIRQARQAMTVLCQPLLEARRGFLKVDVNVAGADLVVDEQRRSTAAGHVIPLAAGPHVVRIDRDGFYSATADVLVRPGRVTIESVTLVPATETIRAYEQRATWMRAGAWTTAALAIGASIGAGVFYARATDNKNFTDEYRAALAVERADLGGYSAYLDHRDSFDTNQGLYIGSLVTAIVAGAAATYLFVAGDPPGRYDEFEAVED